MKFNEDSRVKIPSILHLTRLGYNYLSLKNEAWDESSNIFTDLFKKSISKINPDADDDEIKRLLGQINLSLDNEDLGKAFYEQLIDQSGTKLIDFSNFNNNNFYVVTELTYKNGDEQFRPDIILLINGMPLVFIEVKKPNNPEGVLAERKRINTRFQNKKFKRFVNITQLMVFSNNMEYDNESLQPIQGAFYASPSYHEPRFNYFREEENFDLSSLLKEEDDETENFVLKDNNLSSIKHNLDFATNKKPDTPTNRISTSLFSKDRLSFLLKYALAYANESDGIKKQIMRYPQIFATKAVVNKLDKGIRKGIIWHTQGSGKTALAFYSVRFLSDYYQNKTIITKFYFIVDRIDLLIQAQREFSSRGLIVHIVDSREEFAKEIKSKKVIHNTSGKAEITVVNIQKFKDDPNVVRKKDYNVNIQRIYFLDEVHRSYNPKGSFLANLVQSDPDSIKIGLTGTPLLGEDHNSRALFGDYIHKYYYNSSIADGYTLRLIREDIESNYQMVMKNALADIEVIKGDAERKWVYSHRQFVEPMLDYIIKDFERSRLIHEDNTIGGMVICDSSEQAKEMFKIFETRSTVIDKPNKVKLTALILHDVGTKEDRKKKVEDFKDGKIDLLFVYNMLLTGFDSPRLKKLYLGRVIKKHNLLQALTRVNRTYKTHRFGYVVDFADIREEFDDTNEAYFKELQSELGDEFKTYSDLFKSKEEIEDEIAEVQNILLHYETENIEVFTQQISQIQDKKHVLEIKTALENAKSLYNLIRLHGHYELLEKIDFKKLNIFHKEITNHLDILNLKEKMNNNDENINLLNEALEDVYFKFEKLGEEELIIADKLKNTLRKTREALVSNFDKHDINYITLKEELMRLFKKKNLSEVTQEEMNTNIGSLNQIFERVKELNRKNNLLKAKYQEDPKYARIHKRLIERDKFAKQERQILDALKGLKINADDKVLKNRGLMENESYFESSMGNLIVDQFKNKQNFNLSPEIIGQINTLVVKEYMNEYNGEIAW
jgi:type I restriction enzyme R subunit